ncbi:DUF4307 domain-containing protein [Microbacterium sp. RU33B]|uniref:DUF4307 domain-containing protein n=1 Tax=Microbacterium sp. RU33B TaxID=1907390 RepID=UPI0009593D94|nr:DUF4307 domain-containing protein [Microbacterium sp. RU33B]SIT71317.1 protein of unknown function [Microbacterium sp. RU33B]
MTTQDVLDERYGRRRSPRARWIRGGFIGLAVVVVGAFAWMTVANAFDDIAAETTGFRIEERAVTLDFQLTVPIGRDIACALEAQDEDHGVVGWKIIEIEASDQHTRAFRESIPTVAEATTGLVNTCWVT